MLPRSFAFVLLVVSIGISSLREAAAQTWVERTQESIGLNKWRRTKPEPRLDSRANERVRIVVLNPEFQAFDEVVHVNFETAADAETTPSNWHASGSSRAEFSGTFAESLSAPADNPIVDRDAFNSELDPTNVLDQELGSAIGFAEIQSTGFEHLISNRYRQNHAPVFEGAYESNGETIEHIIAPREELIELAFSRDIGNAWYRLRDDSAGVIHPQNLLTLAIAGGGALALRGDVDEHVRRQTARHPERWGAATDFFGEIGDVQVQVPVMLGVYYLSLRNQDAELHDFSTTLMSAFTINAVSTVGIKLITDTDRPTDKTNNGHYGFPSYHASSSFAIASVIDEYYGAEFGLPAYFVAGLIGWSRIDSRNHDLSDVLFGSVLGYVIGKSVARHHLTGDSRVQILPWFEPSNGTAGVSVLKKF